MQVSREQLKKAMECRSKEELMELAKNEGIELTDEEAQKFLSSVSEKKVDLNDLEDINGGLCAGNVCGLDC